jgi:hypothetical protein
LEDLILGENLIITSKTNESWSGTLPGEEKSKIKDEEIYHFTFRI